MDFDPVQAMRIRDVVHHGTSRDASGTLLLFSVERARFTIDESGSGKERHASMNLEARLDRHHARREGGVPTLSVVSYPRGRHDVNAWAERHSRRLVRIAPFPFAAAVAKALLDSLEAKGGLVARAVEVIAERNGSPPAMRSFDLDGRGRPELEIFLRNALAPISDRGLATLVAAVLETNGAGVTAALDDDLGRDEVRWREILSAIVQILPSGELPVVLFEPGESRELPPDEFRAYVDELARRVEDAPPLPAFLIGPREMLEDAARGRSRAALLVREGLADSDGVDPESVAVSTGDASVEVGAINRDGVLASAAWIDRETPGAGLGERLVDIARAFEEMVESERPPPSRRSNPTTERSKPRRGARPKLSSSPFSRRSRTLAAFSSRTATPASPSAVGTQKSISSVAHPASRSKSTVGRTFATRSATERIGGRMSSSSGGAGSSFACWPRTSFADSRVSCV